MSNTTQPRAWWRASTLPECRPCATTDPEEADECRRAGHEVVELERRRPGAAAVMAIVEANERLRAALAEAGARINALVDNERRLIDDLAEWRKLRDPSTLHVNLLRGVPAQLPQDLYLHLGGVNEIREELAAARAALQHERDCMEAAKTEIQRLSPDARRYQWLFGARTSAQCADEDAGMKDPLPQDKIISMAASWFLAKASIDAAIDAAMARVESDSTGGKPCSTT